jgi:ribose transport system ATP-binding protein
MHEVEALCDTLSVFRNGQHIETFAKGARSEREIVRNDDRPRCGGAVSAEARAGQGRETRRSATQGSGTVLGEQAQRHRPDCRHRGEIVGLGGLDGQGQKELLLALFGVLRDVEGEVIIGGRKGIPSSPAAAKTAATRVALVPEDRKTEGLMLGMPIADNLLASSFQRISRGPFIDPALRGRPSRTEYRGCRSRPDRIRPGHDAVGRQPAEGRHRQMADDRSGHHPAQRPDPRHRCRHQTGDLPADARARQPGQGDPVLLVRLRGTDRLLRPGLGPLRAVSSRKRKGDDITEESLVAASLNIDVEAA